MWYISLRILKSFRFFSFFQNFQDLRFWMLKIYDSQKNGNTKIIIQKVTKSINVTNISKPNQLKYTSNMKKNRFTIFWHRDWITGNDLLVGTKIPWLFYFIVFGCGCKGRDSEGEKVPVANIIENRDANENWEVPHQTYHIINHTSGV